jgi:phage protein D
MSIRQFQVSLRIGASHPSPAPAALMEAVHLIEVNEDAEGRAGFQIQFRAEREAKRNQDFALLNGTLLTPGNRVVITVTLNGTPYVLFDGIIAHQELTPPLNERTGTLTVTGEDISVMMDLEEKRREFPEMNDQSAIAMILEPYGRFGLVPKVQAPPRGGNEVPSQRSTDRRYLRDLARQYGYVFFVKPGTSPLNNIAYWGDPSHWKSAMPRALTVGMGPANNVTALNFRYDALAPTQVSGSFIDAESGRTVDVDVSQPSPHSTSLSSHPALTSNSDFVRKLLISAYDTDEIEMRARAQAIVDGSAEAAVMATGSLDVLHYGDIVRAPGKVGVRGAGYSYDGEYFVKTVKHEIRAGQYTQQFTLVREGLGSRVKVVKP